MSMSCKFDKISVIKYEKSFIFSLFLYSLHPLFIKVKITIMKCERKISGIVRTDISNSIHLFNTFVSSLQFHFSLKSCCIKKHKKNQNDDIRTWVKQTLFCNSVSIPNKRLSLFTFLNINVFIT